jgi:hypothetical protein
MTFSSRINFQQALKRIRSSQANDFIWLGTSPVFLQEEIGDETGADDERENEEGGEFPGGNKSVPPDTEDKDREGQDRSNEGGDRTKAVELKPGRLVGEGPELGLLVVELPGDIHVQIAEEKGQGSSCEENRRDEIENEDPASGHGREDGGFEYSVSSQQCRERDTAGEEARQGDEPDHGQGLESLHVTEKPGTLRFPVLYQC